MAGNIIPAIATTNAIIAGLIVLQALHLLRKSYDALRNVHVQFKPSMPLSAIAMYLPNSFVTRTPRWAATLRASHPAWPSMAFLTLAREGDGMETLGVWGDRD